MAIGAAVAGVVGGVMSSRSSSKAASRAAESQGERADEAVAEQRYQFDKMQELMAPYIEAGSPALKQMAGYADIGPQALSRQKDLVGINGYKAQQNAISNIEQSPLFQAQLKQGEQGILQNASATGGLRGGNTQAALAQFRPNMLTDAINQQYSNLGGLTNFGAGASQNLTSLAQSSAAGQAAQGMNMANSVGNIMNQKGEAEAQGFLARGKAQGDMYSSVAGGIGNMFGGGFGGGF